jgi:hypothetical protein
MVDPYTNLSPPPWGRPDLPLQIRVGGCADGDERPPTQNFHRFAHEILTSPVGEVKDDGDHYV